MVVFFIALLFISLYGIKIRRYPLAPESYYLSKNSTNAIKGIGILLVFLRHANQYVLDSGYAYDSIGDRLFIYTDGLLAQLIVVMFLFFSGYGVFNSIYRDGTKYIQSIPKRRLFNTLINFDVAIIFYVVVALVLHNSLTLKQIFLSLIGWDSVGNSNWYIFVILICYLSTYISFLLVKTISIKRVIIAIILTFILLAITTFLLVAAGKSQHWYDTMWVYPLGMLYALYRNYFERYVANNVNWYVLLFASILIFVISYVLSFVDYPYSYFNAFRWCLRVFATIIMTILIMMRFNIQNRFIVWLGVNLFPLYIYQRIPMIVLSPYLSSQPYIFFVLTFLISCALVYFYKKIEIRLK